MVSGIYSKEHEQARDTSIQHHTMQTSTQDTQRDG